MRPEYGLIVGCIKAACGTYARTSKHQINPVSRTGGLRSLKCTQMNPNFIYGENIDAEK